MPSITTSSLLTAALPVFLIMAAGAVLRRLRVLPREGDGTLLALGISVTYPIFILRAIVGNAALKRPENVWLPLILGSLFMLLGVALSWAAAHAFRRASPVSRRTFALSCSVQNYGYLPIPIMAVLFPSEGWMGILFVYTLGIELVIWTVGVLLMDPHSGGAVRKIFNPVVMSIVVGLALNALPWKDWLPADGSMPPWLTVVDRTSSMLGGCAIPLGLLLVGATLGDLAGRPGSFTDWPAAVGAVIMRLGILPLTMIGVMLLLPSPGGSPSWLAATAEFRHVIGVQAAMPAAVFSVLVARRYGGDEAMAMRVIVITTIVSLLTIPFTLKLALDWVSR